MQNQFQSSNPFMRLIPYLGMGVFLVLVVVALIFLSYLLLIGGIIGLVLFCIAWIRTRFFSKAKKDVEQSQQHHIGRTYDNDDFK